MFALFDRLPVLEWRITQTVALTPKYSITKSDVEECLRPTYYRIEKATESGLADKIQELPLE